MNQVKAVLTVQYGFFKSDLEFLFEKDSFFSFLNRSYMASGSLSCTDVCAWLSRVLGEKFQSTTENMENVHFTNVEAFCVEIGSRSLFPLILEANVARHSWREDKTTVKLFGIMHHHMRNAVNAKCPVWLSFAPA